MSFYLIYRKNSKNWDTLNYYRDCPTNGIVGFYSAILRSKDADRITNRVDTDQTAPLRSSLIWVCTVCSDLSVPIFPIITVVKLSESSPVWERAANSAYRLLFRCLLRYVCSSFPLMFRTSFEI